VIFQAVLLERIGFYTELFLLMRVWMIVVMIMPGVRIVIMCMIGVAVMRMIIGFMRVGFPIVRMSAGVGAGSQIEKTKRAYKD
jgi:hypothetical protein